MEVLPMLLTRNVLILILAGAVLVLTAAAVGIYFLTRFLSYKKGTLGKNRVDSTLKKFGVIRNYKVLKDVHLSVGGREAQIDHMMIGFFGILFVSTVNDTAEYYGEVKDPSWTKVSGKSGEKRTRIDNLVEKNLRNIDVVREIFAKNDVFNIKMEGLVVFCGNRKKTLIGITGSPSLMTYQKFKSYVRKSKFEKDNNVDVPALYNLIMQNRA